MTTRKEHLQWCKDRAIAELNNSKNHVAAWSSFLSDMQKHPETEKHLALALGHTLVFSGNLRNHDAMKKFIEDFN